MGMKASEEASASAITEVDTTEKLESKPLPVDDVTPETLIQYKTTAAIVDDVTEEWPEEKEFTWKTTKLLQRKKQKTSLNKNHPVVRLFCILSEDYPITREESK